MHAIIYPFFSCVSKIIEFVSNNIYTVSARKTKKNNIKSLQITTDKPLSNSAIMLIANRVRPAASCSALLHSMLCVPVTHRCDRQALYTCAPGGSTTLRTSTHYSCNLIYNTLHLEYDWTDACKNRDFQETQVHINSEMWYSCLNCLMACSSLS